MIYWVKLFFVVGVVVDAEVNKNSKNSKINNDNNDNNNIQVDYLPIAAR